MNKKDVITKKALDELSDWIEKNIDSLKDQIDCCAHYYLDDNFQIALGWSDGYDKDDKFAIHNIKYPECCLNIGIKCASQYWERVESDFDYLNSPWNGKTGDVWLYDTTLLPKRNNRHLARWLLEDWVTVSNELKKKKTDLKIN